MDVYTDTVEQYRDFAGHAAAGYSPCFEEWASWVADDAEVLGWLERLPRPKRQPNLVFAAARWHGVAAPGPYDALRRALLDDQGEIRRTIMERATQTNEAGRLATLVPAFVQAAGPGPLALLEVGASAGLCLYPDRYTYAWATADGVRRIGAGPELAARVDGPAPLPDAPPVVSWRGGIDLNPLDVTNADQMDWLTTLVWPEHDDRRAQLVRAIDVARADPPALVRGNLLDELPAVVDRAAEHGPVVVFHSAVIAYLTGADRGRFHELMTGLVRDGRCHWVSNEAPNVLPDLTGVRAAPEGHPGFVLGIDGTAVGLTHGHGSWLSWL